MEKAEGKNDGTKIHKDEWEKKPDGKKEIWTERGNDLTKDCKEEERK